MIYAKTLLRPGTTALAAVIALSSTPLLAEDAEPGAPLVTPPPVSIEAAPSAQTIAPAPAPMTEGSTAQGAGGSMAVPTPAPAAAASSATSGMALRSPVVVHQPAIPTTEPAAVARAPRAAKPPIISSTPTSAAATPAATPPVATSQTETPVAPSVNDEPAPAPAAPVQRRATMAADDADETLPIAGATAAAILLLAGGGYALTRRRRGEGRYVAEDRTVAAAPPAPASLRDPMVGAARDPAIVAPAGAAPAAIRPITQPSMSDLEDADSSTPLTRLPAGFDMSRYGRHVQAAYRGPTENNRSLSLRRRLARARFLDQRERIAAQDSLTAQPAADEAAVPVRRDEFITTRLNRPQRPAFKPVFSS